MIQFTEVNKQYGNRVALKDINLHIEDGVCFGLIGPNGAGKSTLMKILCNILGDYKGDVSVFGQPLQKDNTEIKRRIGYVPQDLVLEEKLTGIDNLSFFGRIYGLKGKPLKDRMDEVLQKVGLLDRKKDAVSSYSGGMKRRLNIACALLHEPDIIILDEPTVGVDPQSRNHIFDIINDLKKEGKTVLYSSHYMEEVESLCDQIALIDQGEIVESGSIRELLVKYSTPSIFIQGIGVKKEDLVSYGSVIEVKDGYKIDTAKPLQMLEQIADLFLTKDVQIERLEITRPSLEDIFLSLTGSSLRD
ncbi:ABC transporter ATP-binding protein [Alkalihalobacterium chitinilyticum]|uniref:ABC transporter ATP-binding protein n=1 Tax=Alkalihalobacterium chitinilyticum TaxID=2980103 RepID=A0ABT5VEG0_9BACI|nr:ABC transporter ATP-binding protein [Alkalihalobacterium chitinilyticum]MDE5413717.1 ABC transporter ATP-binding protein [Alkalihalobacterium chitinilyticum]